MQLSEPKRKAIRLLGDLWFREAIKPNTLQALEDADLVVHQCVEVADGVRVFMVGLTRQGMDEYHKMRGWK